MEKIQKFQMSRAYFPIQRRQKLFYIKSRFGKELTIDVVGTGETVERINLNVFLTADEHGAYEYFLHDNMRIPAYNLLAQARKLTPEEEEYVTKVIEHDIQMRKAKRLDNAEITTVSTLEPFRRKG